MGHVSAGPLSAEGPDHEFPRRQYRRAGAGDRALANQRLARWGESLAAEFLVARGATVVGRNVRAGRGEIDLLVRWARKLVAVEVKTRLGADPRPSFTAHKARKVRTAMGLLSPRPHRLDLVAVEVDGAGVDIRWIPGV